MQKNRVTINLLGDILYFFKNLSYKTEINPIPFYHKIGQILMLIGWLYLILLPISLVLNLLLNLFVYQGENKVGTLLTENPLWFVMIFGAFIGPLLEETLFRLSLKFKPIYASLTSAVFVYYLLNIILGYISINSIVIPIMLFVFPILVGLIIFFITNAKKESIHHFFERYFKVIFYTFVIMFAFMHITNYTDRLAILLIAPLLVLPQLIVGFLLSYIRMRQGFGYAVFAHAIYNGVLLFPSSLVLRDGLNEESLVVMVFSCSILIIMGLAFSSLIFQIAQFLVKRKAQL